MSIKLQGKKMTIAKAVICILLGMAGWLAGVVLTGDFTAWSIVVGSALGFPAVVIIVGLMD